MQLSKLEPLQEGKSKDQQPEEYEVERILQRGNVRGVIHYLVKWKNYPEAEATWQPLSNLSQCQKAISDFQSLIKKLSLIKDNSLQSGKSKSKNNSEKSHQKCSSYKNIKSLKDSMIKFPNRQKLSKDVTPLKEKQKFEIVHGQDIKKQDKLLIDSQKNKLKVPKQIVLECDKRTQQIQTKQLQQQKVKSLQSQQKAKLKLQLKNRQEVQKQQESVVTAFPVKSQVQTKQSQKLQKKELLKTELQEKNISSGIEEVSTNQSLKQKNLTKAETSNQQIPNLFQSSNFEKKSFKRDLCKSQEEDDTLRTMQISNKRIKMDHQVSFSTYKKASKFQIYFKWIDYTEKQQSNIRNQNHSSICKINQFAKNVKSLLQQPKNLQHIKDKVNRNKYLVSMQNLKKMTDYEYLEVQGLCESCKLELIKLNCEYNQECWQNVLKNSQKNAYKQKIVLNQIFDYYIEAYKLFEVLSMDIAILPIS